MSNPPALGKKAPDFDLPVIGGGYGENARVTLADLEGSKVVLCFYPKVKPAEHVDLLLEALV